MCRYYWYRRSDYLPKALPGVYSVKRFFLAWVDGHRWPDVSDNKRMEPLKGNLSRNSHATRSIRPSPLVYRQ